MATIRTPSIAEWVDATARRVGFARAQRRWFSERQREVAVALQDEAYAGARVRPTTDRPARAHRLDRPVHVVVVPQEGQAFSSFRPGTRNFYYEAAQNLIENTGGAHVSVFNVDPGERSSIWHARLIDHLLDTGATHVVAHAEADPGSEGASWTWDVPWTVLASRWDGVFLGVMFDSAFEWIAAKSRRLARISPRYMVVDICMPMDGSMVRGRPEVGPVNMPVSRESLALVDARLAGLSPVWDLSFMGVMYPYRMDMVAQLRAAGVTVAVNPHRTDLATDDVTSRLAQPSWLDYMAGLRSSRITLNFSRSSAGPFEQLKTRVLEATLAGTLLLTDDHDRTRLFWTPGEEFAFFSSPADLPGIIQMTLADPDRLGQVSAAGRARARTLAHSSFWGGVEDGLRRRGLPSIDPA